LQTAATCATTRTTFNVADDSRVGVINGHRTGDGNDFVPIATVVTPITIPNVDFGPVVQQRVGRWVG
jgi:hypothetical protein